MPDRFIPKLDRYFLDIVNTRDDFEASLSIHEYPDSNKNLIEHLGMRPRRVYVECAFYAYPALTTGWSTSTDGIQPEYSEHFFFLDYIRNKKTNFTFTHPKYGEIVGKISSISCYNDDTDEFARITFEFIEETATDDISFIEYIIPEMYAGYRDATEKVTEKVEDDQKAATNAVSWAANARSSISTMDAKLNHLTSPANSITNTINYGTSLPGQVMESLNGAIDRIVVLYQTGRNAPASFINNIIVGVRTFKATLSGVDADYVHIMGSSRVAYEAGVVYDEDDQNYRAIKTKESKPTYDNAGNYIGAAEYPEIMTLTELEFSLYEIRLLINEAILLDRDNRPLQEQARKLQDYVNKIKLDRDRIVTKEYPLQSMHQITRANGLTYQAAERILKLNPDIKNPNFTHGEIHVLTPAG